MKVVTEIADVALRINAAIYLDDEYELTHRRKYKKNLDFCVSL